MLFQKHILAIACVLAIGAVPVFAGQSTTTKSTTTAPAKKADSSKPAAVKAHTAQGSIVAATDESLTLKTGKKNMNFKLSSTTQKPSSMTPGSNVTVSYHDEGNQHIATAVQLAPTKSNATAAKPPASK